MFGEEPIRPWHQTAISGAQHPRIPRRVCLTGAARPFAALNGLDYRRYTICEAVFLDAAALPPPERELAHYMLHENDPYDPRYRRFLSRLGDPLAARLKPGSLGLDYGCGPGPALAVMLREQGHAVRTYDPFFEPEPAALEASYDFIICSEVAEHFHQPAAEFARLDTLLRPGGWLGVMTCFRTGDHLFANWHYRRDPTHVVFYRPETFRQLASRFGWNCEIPRKDVVLLQKPATGQSAR